jgi:hypothetical protein
MLDLYRKALASIFGALAVVLLAQLSDNRITTAEAFVVGIAGGRAVLVYLVPNLPSGVGRYAKFIIAVALAVVSAIALYRDGGFTAQEIVLIVVEGLAAAGVYIVPNDNEFVVGEVLDRTDVPIDG